MRKNALASRLARASGITRAKAADQIDSVFHRVLKNLRQGRSSSLPGLGVLKPGRSSTFRFVLSGPESPGGGPVGRKDKA